MARREARAHSEGEAHSETERTFTLEGAKDTSADSAAILVSSKHDDLYYLERAAQVQTLAKMHGKPLRSIPQQIVEQTARQINEESDLTQVQAHFSAIKRILDRDDPGWRD